MGNCGNRLMVPSMQAYVDRLKIAKATGESRGCTIDGRSIDGECARPRVSIITVAFNSAATIERTILSVLAQTFRDVEYIVIDGGSTDGTVDLIRKWSARLSYWHTCKDGGISDAFNLGIAASHGELIGIVNSDDWMSPDQIMLLVAAIDRSGASFAFGRLAHHTQDGTLLYHMDGSSDYADGIKWRMPPINHPTVLSTRRAFDKVGLFDTSRRVAMDYDWHLRAELDGIKGVYEPQALGHMALGGVCEADWRGGLKEVRQIAIKHTREFFMPNLIYLLRLARGNIRLALYRVAPRWLVHALHRLINPKYSPVRPTPHS